jgi:hypothetical protein
VQRETNAPEVEEIMKIMAELSELGDKAFAADTYAYPDERGAFQAVRLCLDLIIESLESRRQGEVEPDEVTEMMDKFFRLSQGFNRS